MDFNLLDLKEILNEILTDILDWLAYCTDEQKMFISIGTTIALLIVNVIIINSVSILRDSRSVRRARTAEKRGNVVDARLTYIYSDKVVNRGATERASMKADSQVEPIMEYVHTGEYTYTVDGEEYVTKIHFGRADPPETLRLYYMRDPKRVFQRVEGKSCCAKYILIFGSLASCYIVKLFIEYLHEYR